MRVAISAVAVLVLAAVLAALCGLPRAYTTFEQPAATVRDAGLSHPADIVRFKGRYVVAELHDDRLALFDDLSLRNLNYFDPSAIGREFKSPHFLAVTADDTLLISNGWGDSIVEIADLDGGNWKEFAGIGTKFRAPHGICVDAEGWIYVGDSLNSRLVRFRDMDGDEWQVFTDHDNLVSYIRQLVCRNGEVWASNSYENRPGLNRGQGSNVLRITDFESGRAEIVVAIPDANMTGILPLDRSAVLLGLWGARNRLALGDPKHPGLNEYQRLAMGTPYGIYFDAETKQVLVAHIGDLSDQNSGNVGGIAVYR